MAAYGYLVYRNDELIHKGFGAVGEGKGMTDDVAEHEGLWAAVQWIVDEGIEDEIVIKGDSQLVIKQMKGEYRVNSATSKKFVPEIKKLLQVKRVNFVWIPREENEEADRLSRVAYERHIGRKHS